MSSVQHILRWLHNLAAPLTHSPSFNVDTDEDAEKAHFFKTRLLMKYAYVFSANYGQVNFHKAEKKREKVWVYLL